jgi:hypothetical protein
MTKPIDPEKYAQTGTEHAEQVALFIWASQNLEKYPVLRFMFAVPNGGQRNLKVASNLKAEGVKAGAPDIILPCARGIWHGLFIELKRRKTDKQRAGVVDMDQTDFHKGLIEQGYGVAICYGFMEARDCIIQYLEWQQYCVDNPNGKE